MIALALALGACTVSIFEDRDHHHRGDDDAGSGTPPPVPATCGDGCIGDAAADFNGTPTGKTGHWRYLDDHRDHTWLAMTPSATAMTGADANNSITTCAAKPTAAGCKPLPGALLVSTSGSTSAADPAVELTAPADQVLTLSIHALVTSGAPQQIRVYRNAREDALITAVASSGAQVDQSLTLDALKGDRFLVAIAPAGAGASDIALQVFFAPTGNPFPSDCQFAVDFEPGAVNGTNVNDRCHGSLAHFSDADSGPDLASAPQIGDSVFPEMGKATDLAIGTYLKGSAAIDASKPFTVQMWLKLRGYAPNESGWAFSTLDLNNTGTSGGGLGLGLVNPDSGFPAQFDMTSCTNGDPLTFVDAVTPYKLEQWYFVRMVQTAAGVDLCINGEHKTSFALKPPALASLAPPYLGRNVNWLPQGSFFNGEIDDFRVISAALPCN